MRAVASAGTYCVCGRPARRSRARAHARTRTASHDRARWRARAHAGTYCVCGRPARRARAPAHAPLGSERSEPLVRCPRPSMCAMERARLLAVVAIGAVPSPEHVRHGACTFAGAPNVHPTQRVRGRFRARGRPLAACATNIVRCTYQRPQNMHRTTSLHAPNL